jgi:starch synthase/alpha-amylase
MPAVYQNPRVLVVTPEVTYLPTGMGNIANYLVAKAGGLADVSAALVSALFDQGADVHVALPDYRAMFQDNLPPIIAHDLNHFREIMPDDRVHLAEDRAFFYLHSVYSNYGRDNIKCALAFQREVINNIVPRVRPDLIHCNDWMTGLIPAMARRMKIPCLFTIHNIHTVKSLLFEIEDRGIDAAYFWDNLYYQDMAYDYETTRETIPVDYLVSGVFAAHFVNTVSPTFLKEIVEGQHAVVEPPLRQELTNKVYAQCAAGILNAPDPTFNPRTDKDLFLQYGARNHFQGKQANKRQLQSELGLIIDPQAPIFFWPSRLDPNQKGCQLLADILYQVISHFWNENLQIIFVASGEYQAHFDHIVHFHDFQARVAVCSFDEKRARKAYSAADFILMPSRFEPCGLPQMIAPIYGALPVAHDTGGIHDTVTPLDVTRNCGNGFLFEVYDSQGLFWAIEQAMEFYRLPQSTKTRQIERIMREAIQTFNHAVTAKRYIELYEKMLKRPLINH